MPSSSSSASLSQKPDWSNRATLVAGQTRQMKEGGPTQQEWRIMPACKPDRGGNAKTLATEELFRFHSCHRTGSRPTCKKERAGTG